MNTTQTISQADLLIDIGPEAGVKGGNIIGIEIPKIKQFSKSATAKYLQVGIKHPSRGSWRKSQEIIPQLTILTSSKLKMLSLKT